MPLDARILEFGSGNSTLWWLGRGNSVVSLETSPEWAERVLESVGETSERLDLVVGEIDNCTSGPVNDLIGLFDVVVIDHSGDRVSAVKSAVDRLSERGMLLLDNSDRPEYAPAMELLLGLGFRKLDFHGLGPINAYAWTTSVFFRGNVVIGGQSVNVVTVPNS